MCHHTHAVAVTAEEKIMSDYSHLGDHVGASDVCMVCRNELADFTATGGQWCQPCSPINPEAPVLPTFEAAWKLYSDGAMPLADTFDLAAGIDCIDGEWKLNACPNAAVAGMHTLSDGIYDLHREGQYEAWFARLGCYDRLRDALEGIYPNLHASVSDPWQFDTYSDLFKDDNGYRPRGHVTGPEVREWIRRRDAE